MESFQEQDVVLLIALGIAIMTALGLSMVLFYYQTRRRLMSEALRHQQLLLEMTILTQEKERKRIAKDLHDEVGGKLNVAHLYLQQLKKTLHDDERVTKASEGITEMINSAITTTRRISHDLLPPILEEFGLERALFELAKNYSKSDSLTVHVTVTIDQFPIAGQIVELSLFRIIQELISNSIKHGEAKQLHIELTGDQENIRLAYRDDGKGLPADKSSKPKGLGMKNIESRLQIVNGNWKHTTQPGVPFQAEININLSV